jgi:succinate dehydrogenase flavin-adding protein (antitoxin of CptAB toxin-antitoxin module)
MGLRRKTIDKIINSVGWGVTSAIIITAIAAPLALIFAPSEGKDTVPSYVQPPHEQVEYVPDDESISQLIDTLKTLYKNKLRNNGVDASEIDAQANIAFSELDRYIQQAYLDDVPKEDIYTYIYAYANNLGVELLDKKLYDDYKNDFLTSIYYGSEFSHLSFEEKTNLDHMLQQEMDDKFIAYIENEVTLEEINENSMQTALENSNPEQKIEILEADAQKALELVNIED